MLLVLHAIFVDGTSGLSDWGDNDAYVQFSVNTDTATNNNYPYKITEYNSAGDVLASPTPVQFTNAGADFIVVRTMIRQITIISSL